MENTDCAWLGDSYKTFFTLEIAGLGFRVVEGAVAASKTLLLLVAGEAREGAMLAKILFLVKEKSIYAGVFAHSCELVKEKVWLTAEAIAGVEFAKHAVVWARLQSVGCSVEVMRIGNSVSGEAHSVK